MIHPFAAFGNPALVWHSGISSVWRIPETILLTSDGPEGGLQEFLNRCAVFIGVELEDGGLFFITNPVDQRKKNLYLSLFFCYNSFRCIKNGPGRAKGGGVP